MAITEAKEFLQTATMTRIEAGNRLAATRLTDEQRVLIEDVLIMYDQLVERLGWADRLESAVIQDARELEEVVRLGERMRAAQKLYFRDRSGANLDLARKLEREFDVAAAKKLDEEPKKPTLFG